MLGDWFEAEGVSVLVAGADPVAGDDGLEHSGLQEVAINFCSILVVNG